MNRKKLTNFYKYINFAIKKVSSYSEVNNTNSNEIVPSGYLQETIKISGTSNKYKWGILIPSDSRFQR